MNDFHIKGWLNWLPDDTLLKFIYRIRFDKNLNLKNPRTFNEKIQWLKLYDRKAQYTRMVDKYAVRKLIKKNLGDEYLIPLLGVWNTFEEINFDELPNQFVMKCTHDSGSVIICKDKEKFDINEAKEKMKKALNRNYYYLWREWPYKNIKPRIIAEKYMLDESNSELKDYKFMVFNGEVKCSFVCHNRYGKEGLYVDFYDKDWNRMSFERHYHSSNIILPKPKNYDLMVKISEDFSKGIRFIRIDFYEINGKLYFGEFTFYPGSGLEEFSPEWYDKKFGSWLNLKEEGHKGVKRIG
ncbi:glycosyl transferase [Anaerosacchariphilus polymeriproducens]|uniref:Glycosyl transferase n=2 Tax=Anaerosacchariphilus polymeriproducens TaxID=1812858 RepID=A0A371ATI5_9FIRM|nr:glycosyl transferase [Anaerosacchariphilus polymeriproducens]